MTTGSGKKTSKTGKAPASRGRRKKIVDKAPAPAEIDKEKMAAFFSTAGVEKSASDSVKESAEVEETKKTAFKESGTQLLAGSTTVSVAENGPTDESESVAKEPGNDKTIEVIVPTETIATDKNSDNEKAEAVGASIPPAMGGGSDSGSSYSVLSMVFVLAVLALFWFYYIASTPLKKAAVVQVESGKAEISVLMSKIGSLEAEVARLRAQLVVFEKAAQKPKIIIEKVPVPAKSGAVVEKKPVAKVVVKGSSARIKKDPSFDKAPIPFWRQPKRGPLAQPRKEVKPAVKTPVVNVDSFSKAPKPFWLKARVKPEAAKVKKEVKLSAPPIAKVAPKAKKITVKQEPASAPVLDPSFKKAPKPFWLKD